MRRRMLPSNMSPRAARAAAAGILAVGCALIFVFMLAAAFPSVFTDHSPKEMFEPWQSPSPEHILGTNDMGYDVFAELVYATGRTLFTGIASAALALAIGTLLGLTAGCGGAIGSAANALIDIFAMIPKLPATIVIAAFAGSGLAETVAVIAAFGWVTTARAVRAKVMRIKERPFIEALKGAGYSPLRIAFRHVLPNLGEVVLTRFITTVASCIMTEATMSFIGLGSVTSPTWGTMINLAYKRGGFVMGAYGWLLAPGAAIMLLALAFWCLWYFAENRSRDVGGRSYTD